MGLIDRYQVLRQLGRGGAGDVYLARDRLSGGREVALKTIRARVDDVLRAAFEREFLTMASLSLPGVAQVHDFGVMAERPGQAPNPFFTRAFIDGQPLDEAADGLDVAGRLALFGRVARVIAPLHRVGVVHGDIKPGNAIIDACGRAWLIDFGLSSMRSYDRELDPTGAIKSAQAGTASVGTPEFMAPELLRGGAAAIPADIYALGVTLWALLLGQYPYASLGARAIAAKLDGKLPEIPLSVPATSRAALLIAQRALARDPLDRFPSVHELIVSLDRATLEAEGGGRTPGSRASAPPPQLNTAAAFADASPRAAPRPDFVAPRPRGHGATLRELVGAIAERGPASAVWLVHGPSGAGKSLVLRELKWRLQLSSRVVFEVFAGRSSGARVLLSLLDQLVLALGPEHEQSRACDELIAQLRSGKLEESAASDALSRLLGAVSSEASVVILVDDLDHADAVVAAVLRSGVHAQSAPGVALVASAKHGAAPSVKELQPVHLLALPSLTPADAAALAVEALGPLDETAIKALVGRAQGLPGALVSMLYRLSGLSAVTPSDVAALPPAAAALAITDARLRRLAPAARGLLDVLSVVSALPESQVVPVLQLLDARDSSHDLAASRADEAAASAVLAQLRAAGLIAHERGALMLSERALRDALLFELGPVRQRRLAQRVLAAPLAEQLELSERARLAVLAQQREVILALVPQAAEALSQAGAFAAAAELWSAFLAHAEAEVQSGARLQLARTRLALGESEVALELAKRVAQDPQCQLQDRAHAGLTAARALTALGRFDDAVSELGFVPEAVGAEQRARVQRELAKVHLRRGDYAAVELAADVGLACSGASDPTRIELLCYRGMALNYRGDQGSGRRCHEEALRLARALGSRRDEANALAYLAIGCQRGGEMVEARDLFAQSLEIARELGDVGNMANHAMNLGVVLFYLGDHAGAAQHYEAAIRLARRAGRVAADLQARQNLAYLHLYFGMYETARGELEPLIVEADARGQQFVAAQAAQILGEVLARTAHVEQALIQYDDAAARYTKLGQPRELAELHLDAASALLDRGGPVDASAAAARLAIAREQIDREGIEDLRLRVELQIARARLANGDAEGAVAALKDVVERARRARDREVEWPALYALSLAQEQAGTAFGSRRNAHLAMEVLEEIALRLPREYRESFWHDPRRRAVRERAQQSEASALETSSGPHSEIYAIRPDAERERLLEIIKRVASEHDLQRLLDRITESAVELSGAERGSVLLVGEDGALAPQVTRARMPAQEEAHAVFSRSIAEAVLIDGEPIVTVDATLDGRLQSYVSVHKLMLRSVACLPIRGHSGPVGVLYLEHRRSRGRFSEAAVDLLCAFADQAAIAIENARLLDQTRRQTVELEEANHELSRAKSELEDALLLRTRQLDDVQRELSRATRQAAAGSRHGIVGRGPGMQRVFDAIGRLAGNTVPVVVCGESGTGKELVARAIHYGGARASQPFVAIQCGSLPDTLLESELFGHVKGAFSGADRDKRGMIAAASGGTLFLDEVSEMSPKMQVGLLRVLQERKLCRVGSETEEPVDVRLIAATQRPLADLVARGQFREDLFYRLSVVQLTLPALRERREDIPALCDHFLRDIAARESIPRRHLTRAALARLMELPWPGNVRQLGHVLLQACVMAEGTAIDVHDLGLGDLEPPLPAADIAPAADGGSQPPLARVANLDHHKSVEKQRILDALEACGWNRVRAAQALGMPRRTFYRRLSDYSIL